jgi:hypothetical protein
MRIGFSRRLLLLLSICAAAAPLPAQQRKTRHVIFVMTDGFRW